jgi:RNA polymerase sigma factor (sigma-70 family)
MTEEELLQHFAKGNSEGITELYLRLKTGMYSYIYNRVQDPHVADDIMQDVWLKLVRDANRIVEFVDDDALQFSLRAYLYRMAGNRIVDHYRSSGRLQALGDEEEYLVSGTPDLTQSISNRELAYCVERRMRPLRMKLHEAFWLTRDESMSYQQAALALGVAKETVKDWVKQVLKAIRRCREEYDYDRS